LRSATAFSLPAVLQHGGQLALVFRLEQGGHRVGRQLGKSGIGGRKHRERPRPLQRIDQPGGLHGRDQCGVILRIDGVLDDVPVGIHRRPANRDGTVGSLKSGRGG